MRASYGIIAAAGIVIVASVILIQQGGYDDKLAELNAGMAEQEEEISRLNAGMAEQEEEISRLNAGMAEQEEEISRLNAGMAEQEEEISRLNAGMAEQEEEISRLNAGMAEQEEEISRLNAELADMSMFSHKHDVRVTQTPKTDPDPTPVPTLTPTTPGKASIDFEGGLGGWALHAILSDKPVVGYPNPYSYYQMELTMDDSYHVPLAVPDPHKTTTHAKIYGDGWLTTFGLANIIDTSGTDRLTLSFDAKIAGLNAITYAPEEIPSLRIAILDDTYDKVVKLIILVGPNNVDQTEDNGPWKNYEVDLTPYIKDKTSLPLMISQRDSWIADGKQVLWIDNIKLATG